jgi:hypothetical protein
MNWGMIIWMILGLLTGWCALSFAQANGKRFAQTDEGTPWAIAALVMLVICIVATFLAGRYS